MQKLLDSNAKLSLTRKKKSKTGSITSFAFDRGIAGDLFISLHVNEKQGIWRNGLNLYSKINVDYTQAILGTVLKVIIVSCLLLDIFLKILYLLLFCWQHCFSFIFQVLNYSFTVNNFLT